MSARLSRCPKNSVGASPSRRIRFRRTKSMSCTQPMLNSSLWSNLKRLLKIRHIITNILKTWTTINLFPFVRFWTEPKPVKLSPPLNCLMPVNTPPTRKVICLSIRTSSSRRAYMHTGPMTGWLRLGKRRLMSMSCAGNSNGSSVKDPPSFA